MLSSPKALQFLVSEEYIRQIPECKYIRSDNLSEFQKLGGKSGSAKGERLVGRYIQIYVVQVAFQVSFQVGQVTDHVESDLLSPVVSYGPRILRSVNSLLIISRLCKGWRGRLSADA